MRFFWFIIFCSLLLLGCRCATIRSTHTDLEFPLPNFFLEFKKAEGKWLEDWKQDELAGNIAMLLKRYGGEVDITARVVSSSYVDDFKGEWFTLITRPLQVKIKEVKKITSHKFEVVVKWRVDRKWEGRLIFTIKRDELFPENIRASPIFAR